MTEKIRIYKVLGEGFVVAKEKKKTKENIWVEYPSVFKMFQGQKQNEVFFKCVDLVPNFFKDFEEQIKNFPLKQSQVYMEGKPDKIVVQLYEQYLKDLTKKLMNIEVVGADALNRLPKMPAGGPSRQ